MRIPRILGRNRVHPHFVILHPQHARLQLASLHPSSTTVATSPTCNPSPTLLSPHPLHPRTSTVRTKTATSTPSGPIIQNALTLTTGMAQYMPDIGPNRPPFFDNSYPYPERALERSLLAAGATAAIGAVTRGIKRGWEWYAGAGEQAQPQRAIATHSSLWRRSHLTPTWHPLRRAFNRLFPGHRAPLFRRYIGQRSRRYNRRLYRPRLNRSRFRRSGRFGRRYRRY